MLEKVKSRLHVRAGRAFLQALTHYAGIGLRLPHFNFLEISGSRKKRYQLFFQLRKRTKSIMNGRPFTRPDVVFNIGRERWV